MGYKKLKEWYMKNKAKDIDMFIYSKYKVIYEFEDSSRDYSEIYERYSLREKDDFLRFYILDKGKSAIINKGEIVPINKFKRIHLETIDSKPYYHWCKAFNYNSIFCSLEDIEDNNKLFEKYKPYM